MAGKEETVTSRTSRDMPGPKPRKDKGREKREAAIKQPEKTNDLDRDQVHGDGETIGIAPKPDDGPD